MSDPHDILNNLKVSGNLPSMPQVLVRLIDACHQQEVDLQEVAGIVKKDATLSAKILQLMNSAFIGARNSFTDIRQAVIFLGADTVRNLAVSISVQQVFRRVETNGLLSIDRFWYHSYENALLARKIAGAVSYPNPSEAYLGGLLHDIGKLLLWMAFPGKYAPLLLKGVRCHNARLAFLEQEKLQINHCEAGAWLLKQWHLPSLFADAIRFHHHPADEVEQGLPLVRIIYLADLLSHAETVDEECREVAHRFFRLDASDLAELSEGIDEQLREVSDNLGIRIPKKSHSSLEQKPESETRHKETSAGLISRIRDITQMTGMLDNLLRAENKEQIAAAIEQSMKILFNEDTCLLLLMDRKNRELAGIVSPDNRLGEQARQVRFRPDRHKDSLPGRAVWLQQIMHSFMKHPDSGKTMLDTQLLHLLGTEGMAIIPMVHRKQMIGLIVAGISRESHLSLLGNVTPVQLLAGQAAVSLHLFRQQQEEAEKMAAERLEAAAMVARKIAHEINNPLAILRNFMKILELKLKDNEEVREDLAIIDQEFARIGQITNQLGDLSAREQVVRMQSVDLNQLLEDILTLYRTSLPGNRLLKIKFHPGPELPRIRTDPDAIRQVMINLLANSVDALQDEGTITIKTRLDTTKEKEPEILLTVADTGPGIPESLRSTLFNPCTTTKGGGHSGLGLAIVQQLLGRLRGTISCTSSDKGTIFSVSFPCHYT